MKISDLSAWEGFYWVAREASFTKAARRMRVGVPLLSKRVARLEDALGVKLLHRSTRKVSLTDEGHGVLPRLHGILEDLEALELRFEPRAELSGTIRVSAIPGLAHRALAPVLADFTRRHPRVDFHLDLSEQIRDIIEAGLDLALRADPGPADTSLVFRKLSDLNLVFCASPAYLEQHGRPRKPPELASHRMLMLDQHLKCRFQRGRARLGELASRRAFRCNSGMFLTELALRGQGIAVRAKWDALPHLESGELVEVLERHRLETYGSLYAVLPSRRLLSPRVRAFLDFLVARAGTWQY